jgi:superfamily II DNA or RNA helicase
MDTFANRFGLLVVDEAHHFGSGRRAEALEMCSARARLGLTATPPEDPEARARLDRLVGPVVCHYTVSGLAGTHLAPFDHLRFYVDLTPDEQRRYRSSRAPFMEVYRHFRQIGGGRSWRDFLAFAATRPEGRRALVGFHEARRTVSLARAKMETAVKLLLEHREDRCLLFTADNVAAYQLSRWLLIPALTCDVKRKERTAVLESFRAGRVRALVSSRVLNEGIDLPDARVGIIMGGAMGTREHVQRVGRLLRPARGKRAVVYEVVARDTFEVGHSAKRQRSLVS